MEKTRFDLMAYGPLGKAVKDAMPHTEADPIGVFAAVLSMYSAALSGNVFQPNGRPVVVWTALAGRSKIGRKGFALATASAICSDAIGDFLSVRRRQGISSGPALVTTLFEAVHDSAMLEGGPDGRIFVVEEEWSAQLKRTNRCPTFSSVFRTAWDGNRVVNTTKGKNGERDEQNVESPMMGFHAHIQPGIWAKYISAVEALGGSYNRILPVMVERSKLLKTTRENPLKSIKPSSALRLAYEWARKEERAMELSDAACERYDELREFYEDEMAEMPESLACFVERSDEQVMRVACVLTAAMRKTTISVEAIEAARSFVEYSITSVRQLVTESAALASRPVMELDERIRKVLRDKGPQTRTQLYRSLGSRFTAAQIEAEAAQMPDVLVEKQDTTTAEGFTRGGRKPTLFTLLSAKDREEDHQAVTVEPAPKAVRVPVPKAAPPVRPARKRAAPAAKVPAKKVAARKAVPAARKPPAKKATTKAAKKVAARDPGAS
ncbi:hypothetical protein [Streptomyces sp. H27-H5]|uniref:hypothetical protein n=1 Tax=Streptomyces sp. H27-H5 TaxID=2996460 RepID=UPI002270A08C|nr:hypothetical protein [Streptomyces sp. H27-H5]MCY0955820.1 hypothetical protein [Streptomyces sp. H27-H5]